MKQKPLGDASIIKDVTRRESNANQTGLCLYCNPLLMRLNTSPL